MLERNDPTRRGKGYALQSGAEHFQADPPAVVIVIDADCRLRPGCLDALAAQVAQTSRPAQACYLMTPPPVPRAIDVVSSLAVLVKNRVRPLAMAKMRLPCLITGSGSAFPWAAIQRRSFAGGNIVEDMQFAVDLALAGFSPAFCDRAVVLAGLPEPPFGIRQPAPAMGARTPSDAPGAGTPAIGGVLEDGPNRFGRDDGRSVRAASIPLGRDERPGSRGHVALGTPRQELGAGRRCRRGSSASVDLSRHRLVAIRSGLRSPSDVVDGSCLRPHQAAPLCDISFSPRTNVDSDYARVERGRHSRLTRFNRSENRASSLRSPWSQSSKRFRRTRRFQ